jgi:hypothetical protein
MRTDSNHTDMRKHSDAGQRHDQRSTVVCCLEPAYESLLTACAAPVDRWTHTSDRGPPLRRWRVERLTSPTCALEQMWLWEEKVVVQVRSCNSGGSRALYDLKNNAHSNLNTRHPSIMLPLQMRERSIQRMDPLSRAVCIESGSVTEDSNAIDDDVAAEVEGESMKTFAGMKCE